MPCYDKTYNDIIADYKTLHFKRFYTRIFNVDGVYSEVIRLRDLYLNGKHTEWNKEEVKAGKKLCTPEMIEQKNQIVNDKYIALHQLRVDNAINEYEEYKKSRKKRGD